MSALSLADIKRERDKLLYRQANNEEFWKEFLASPAVPLAQRGIKTLDEWTAWKRNWYEGTKTRIAEALERLRDKEERIRLSLAAEAHQESAIESHAAAMADYYHMSSKQPAYSRPSSDTIDVALFERLKNYPEQRTGKNVYETLHDLFRFMIYDIKMDDYDPAMKEEIVAVRRVLNDDPVVLDHLPHIAKALRDHVNDRIHKLSPDTDNWAEVDQISRKYFDKTFRGRGGHKSARRGKSRSKSKCRSKSKSKKHRCRG